jgi:hypothetical protein
MSHFLHLYGLSTKCIEAHAPGTFEAQEKCWENVPTWFMDAMNVDMTQFLSLVEITKAITLFPKGKALGHDGIQT